jgi:hypothetical protein
MSPNKKNNKKEQEVKETCPETQTAASKNVAVYDSGFCQIGEVLERELKQGVNRIYIPVPTTYQPDSLNIDDIQGPEGSTLKIKSISYQPASRINSQSILSRSRGKQVVVRTGTSAATSAAGALLSITETGQGAKEIALTSHGTPYVLDGTILLLKVPSDLPLSIELDKLPEGLSEEVSLEVEVEASQAGVYQLSVGFRADSINWNARHALNYDAENNVVTEFNTFASVNNNSGLNFTNVELSLVTGDTGNQTAFESANSRAMPMKLAAASFSAPAMDSAEMEELGETKSFDVPGTVSLGASTTIPLGNAKIVPARREFFVNAVSLRYLSQSPSKQDASVRLLMTNNQESNLGTPLPEGKLVINQRNKKGQLRPTGSAHLPYVPAGEEMSIVVCSSKDVTVERKVLSQKEQLSEPVPEEAKQSANTVEAQKQPQFMVQTKTTTYELQTLVTNFKKETVGVLVNEQLPRNGKLVKESFRGLTQGREVAVKPNAGGDTFVLAVTAESGKDKAVEITYTVVTTEEVRIPVPAKPQS